MKNIAKQDRFTKMIVDAQKCANSVETKRMDVMPK